MPEPDPGLARGAVMIHLAALPRESTAVTLVAWCGECADGADLDDGPRVTHLSSGARVPYLATEARAGESD